PVRYSYACRHHSLSAVLLERFNPRRSTLPNHPSQPPGISHTFTTCGQRPVMPIVYQVPRSSKPTFSSPDCWSVCSMYSHWCMPVMSTISCRNRSRSAAWVTAADRSDVPRVLHEDVERVTLANRAVGTRACGAPCRT